MAKHKRKTVNRDAQVIARRERNSGERRVYKRKYVPQDDRRLHFPSEDFFGPIERSLHDETGKVIDHRQRTDSINPETLPKNVNENPSSTSAHRRLFEPVREFFDNIRISVCQRRKTRREVLFAKRRTGKGAQKRRHAWSSFSEIFCKN